MPTKFEFLPTAYEEGIEAELARALEQRTELISRAAHPEIWRRTDRMTRYAARGRAGSRGRKLLRGVLTVFLLLAGLFLLIPGLMEPQGLRIPLIVGALAVLVALLRLLRPVFARTDKRFRKAAELLLRGLRSMDSSQETRAVFDEAGMAIRTRTEERSVPYGEIETWVETPRLFLLTYGGCATVLQKKDLIAGDAEAFAAFLTDHSSAPHATLNEKS